MVQSLLIVEFIFSPSVNVPYFSRYSGSLDFFKIIHAKVGIIKTVITQTKPDE